MHLPIGSITVKVKKVRKGRLCDIFIAPLPLVYMSMIDCKWGTKYSNDV